MELNNQGSDAWINQRIGKFTSSQIHRLLTEPKTLKAKANNELSEGAKTYVLEKIVEIVTGRQFNEFTNEATAWGHEHECKARDLYSEQTGNEIIEVGFVAHPEITNYGGSPDGMFKNFEKGIEIKCPFNPVHHLEYCLIDSDEYFKTNHKDHYWQCMSNMLINGVDEWDFISFCPYFQTKLFIYTLKRNEDDCNFLLRKVQRANDHLIEMIERLKILPEQQEVLETEPIIDYSGLIQEIKTLKKEVGI